MEIQRSKTGEFQIPLLNHRCLHSPYRPLEEAERFLAEKTAANTAKPLLIIGDVGGFVTRCALTKGFPSVCLVLSNLEQQQVAARNLNAIDSPLHRLQWALPDSFSLPPSFAKAGWHTLIWERTVNLDPALAAFVQRLPALLAREVSVFRTNEHFALSWLRNSRRQLQLHSVWFGAKAVSNPVCIVASGPSLSRQLSFLRRHRHRMVILATTSALLPLEAAGIPADAAIQTDASYWAQRFVALAKARYPLFSPLGAAPFSNADWIPLHQDNALSQLFSAVARPDPPPPMLHVPELGSVACTALRVAQQLTRAPIFYAGLDLQPTRELTHIPTHDSLLRLQRKTEKISPLQTLLWKEHPPLPDPAAKPDALSPSSLPTDPLSIYRRWFSEVWEREHSFYRLEYSAANGPDNLLSFAEAASLLKAMPPKKFTADPVFTLSSESRRRLPETLLNFVTQNSLLRSDLFPDLSESQWMQRLAPLLARLRRDR